MNFAPTDEQKMVREMVRKFAEAQIKPIAAELDRTHRHPEEICRNPWPGFPRRLSAGTSASSKTSSAVPEAKIPIFSSTFPTLKPGVFFKSTIRLMIPL